MRYLLPRPRWSRAWPGLALAWLPACPPEAVPPPAELLFPQRAGELVIADLNGDGLADVAASSGTDAFTFFGQDDGSLSAPVTTSLAPLVLRATLSGVDLNGDGAAELISTGTVGDGTHRSQVFAAAGQAYSEVSQDELLGGIFASPYHAIADFDADGQPDLAVIQNEQVFVYPGLDGRFGETPQIVLAGIEVLSRSLSTGDFDGDGRQDLAGCGEDGAVILFGAASAEGPTFEAPLLVSAENLIKTRTGDLNGDGRPELLAVGRGLLALQAVSLDAARVASPVEVGAVGGAPAAGELVGYVDFVPADLDGDGRLDLAALRIVGDATGTSIDLAAARNTGAGFVGAAPLRVNVLSAVPEVEAGDIDGDGTIDLVVSDSDRLRLARNPADSF